MANNIRIPGGGTSISTFYELKSGYNSGSWGTSAWTADKDYSFIIAESNQANGGQTYTVDCTYSGDQSKVLWKGCENGNRRTSDLWHGIILVKDVKKGDVFRTGNAVNHSINIYCLEKEK